MSESEMSWREVMTIKLAEDLTEKKALELYDLTACDAPETQERRIVPYIRLNPFSSLGFIHSVIQ